MKDAKGHGSDAGAHSSGIRTLPTATKTYSWTKDARGIHRLSAGNNIMTQIGSVIPQTGTDGKKFYRADYNFPGSTGNANSGWSQHKSPTSAKAYVESNLAKFWEPPKVQQ